MSDVLALHEKGRFMFFFANDDDDSDDDDS